MEWFFRLIGIGLIAGLVVWSVDYHQTAVAVMELSAGSNPAVKGEKAEILSPGALDAELARIVDPPRYLNFTPGFEAGNYRIADLPSSDDRDITPRRGSTSNSRSSSSRNDDDDDDDDDTSNRLADSDFPVEFDLVPGESLAPRGEMDPGLYATSFETRDCSFQLRRVMKDKVERVIGEDHLRSGRMLVSINEVEPDSFVSVPQCGEWMPWSPLVEPLKVTSNGDYWVADLEAGGWAVPEGCIWEKVVAFRGAELADVVESDVGPNPLFVTDETLGVRIRGCREPIRHFSVSGEQQLIVASQTDSEIDGVDSGSGGDDTDDNTEDDTEDSDG